MGAPTPAAPHSHSGLRFRNRLIAASGQMARSRIALDENRLPRSAVGWLPLHQQLRPHRRRRPRGNIPRLSSIALEPHVADLERVEVLAGGRVCGPYSVRGGALRSVCGSRAADWPRLIVDGRSLGCGTRLAYAGAYQLTIWTIVPELATELHSSYLGHPKGQTVVAHLHLRPGEPPVTLVSEPAGAELPVREARRLCLYDHLAVLRELFA
jgi:hypothetical protein